MLEALRAAGVARPQIDLGHVGILHALVARSGISGQPEQRLFEALQRKDMPELRSLTREVPAAVRDAFLLLPQLYGDEAVLREASRRLPRLPEIDAAIRMLRRLAGATSDLAHAIRFDLSELRGYRYHSGVVFAAYAPGWSGAVARGGRYDEVGIAFGRARPATGFSLDLRDLASVIPDSKDRRILAPSKGDEALARLVRRLRSRGDIVVNELPGHAAHRAELRCSHAIVRTAGQWVVRKLA
jgi:ATP phosphoribosyltransferase regulatory subunit